MQWNLRNWRCSFTAEISPSAELSCPLTCPRDQQVGQSLNEVLAFQNNAYHIMKCVNYATEKLLVYSQNPHS